MSDLAHTDGAPSSSGSLLGDPITDRFEVRATATDHFAWLRTRASIERTMMSWIRTAVSLISWLRVSGTAKMPQIDHGVRHQLHAVMALLFELKAQQESFELILPCKGPLHA